MGVVKRQSIKHSIINYIGVAVGAFSTLFIYPLAKEVYGLTQFLISMAAFLVPLASLGILSLTVRYFPTFHHPEKKHHGYLGILLIAILGAASMFLVFITLFQDSFIALLDRLKFNTDLFQDNALTLGILCFIAIMNALLVGYIRNFRRIAIPALLSNFIPKVALPTLVALFYFKILTTEQVVYGVLGYYTFIMIALVFYTRHLGQLHLKPNFKFIDKKLLREMGTYSVYGILGTMGGILAFRIDGIMVSSLLDLGSNGIYSMMLFMAGVVEIPATSIVAIVGPIIASAWKNNDIDEIRTLYKKTSLNLLIAGIFIFLLIWVSVDSLFQLSSNYEDLALGLNALLFLGLAKLVDMVTSINDQIIRFSKYFRFNLVAIVSLGILNIFINYLLIPRYQITGAAMATFFSLFMFNLLKLIYIRIKLKMHPFTWNTLWVVVLGGITYGVVSVIPDTNIPLLDIVIKSGVIALIYIPNLLYFKLSEDINEVVFRTWNNLKSRLFKK